MRETKRYEFIENTNSSKHKNRNRKENEANDKVEYVVRVNYHE